jgi:lysophospholipase L1-like esterase
VTLVAVGDSIVHAEDSWGAWLARAMGADLRRVSANGARTEDVLEQLPLVAGERYAVACLSIGTNDVLFDWDAEVYAERLGRIVAALGEAAEQVVAATVSLSLAGFPGGGSGIRRRAVEANAAIAASGATVIAGDDLHGPKLLQADRIHPTQQGQLLLADRAATALGVVPLPSTLAQPSAGADRWTYHRVAAGQAPRQAVKRALRRPMYRDPRGD